jgi:hypothetical protein
MTIYLFLKYELAQNRLVFQTGRFHDFGETRQPPLARTGCAYCGLKRKQGIALRATLRTNLESHLATNEKLFTINKLSVGEHKF